MEVVLALVIQIIAGGAGGNVVGQLTSSLDLGVVRNTIVGAFGGIVGIFLVGAMPGISSLVDVTPGTAGDVDLGALAGQGAVALTSGVALTLIAGLIKCSMAKAKTLR